MNFLRLLLCSLLLAGGLSVSASAQEATAGAKFNSDNARLSNRVEVLRAVTESAGDSITRMLACNQANQLYDAATRACRNIQPHDILHCARQGMLWDGVSCVDTRLTTEIERMLACQRQGQFWNGTACVNGAVVDNILTRIENTNTRVTQNERDLAAMLACQRAGYLWMGTACREANIQALNDSINCQRQGYVYANAGSCRTTVVTTSDYRWAVIAASSETSRSDRGGNRGNPGYADCGALITGRNTYGGYMPAGQRCSSPGTYCYGTNLTGRNSQSHKGGDDSDYSTEHRSILQCQ